jgi:F-type H+-transporting ATPase subunit epsilon
VTGTIRLEVVSPERKVLEADVEEVVLPGSEGYLGVRPGHTPLLTSLGIGELSYTEGGRTHHLALARGFAEILPDRVNVLAEEAERADEIDVAGAEEARRQALGRLQGESVEDTERQAARDDMERASVRIAVARKR